MPTYLEVAVNVPQVADVFDYHLPPELEGQIQVGHLVEVPFGRQRVQGIVLRFLERPSVAKTKPLAALVDPQAVVTPAQIALAVQLSKDTLAPLAACMRLMIPPGLTQQADTLYTLTLGSRPARSPALSAAQLRLVEILEKRGPLRGRQIDAALPRRNWRAAARSLLQRGLLSAQAVLPGPTVRPKTARTVQLACSPQAAEQALPNLGRAGSPALERRQAILRFLLRERAPVEASWVYAESGGNLSDLQALEQRGLVLLGSSEVWRDPLESVEPPPSRPHTLTPAQQAGLDEIQQGFKQAAAGQEVAPFLLHGVTSSGKTEVYLRAVEAVLERGQQAIILVPEIALTPQTVRRFVSRFPGWVGLVHSQLSEGERYDTWRRARTGELSVIVGPRSALFTPFARIGLIVVDECHDDSYYQDEPPFYDARRAAVTYAGLLKAVCIFGSATPDVNHTYQAAQGRWRYLPLPERIRAHQQFAPISPQSESPPASSGPASVQGETLDLPPVRMVDMRQELKDGNRSIFSRPLQTALSQVLERQQQAILFLNRRGTATHVFCRDCGRTLKCPRCDLPLTFHGPQQDLVCHRCGYRRGMPRTCPDCKSERIRQYGIGTERVEAEVQALHPQARLLRWDYETTRKKGAHEAILTQFAAHRADILVGTQMLAKGLDLPLVTLVGVILADVGLNMPDYSAAERTFQVLTQVAGRAGRSPLGGEVIFQTFQPEHYVLQAAAQHSYREFYRQELEYRRQLGYPPFARLVRLEFRHSDERQAEEAAQKMAGHIHTWLSEEGRRATELVGPAPCFFSRLGGFYRWQIVLRGPAPLDVLRGRSLPDWRVEVDPPSLL